ncbi:uncharacterized protein K441DRAFT_674379 [Cenococcum geophilum 1.58]|uniref:uncharacterized protein n=1 Tax=Cenococcum geophilum 1.58 TaxID=794803 RepID=UPI00358EC366|nr:hypothetical protein K441DRAFT_674379 [Cenococcum geophilum 1.58]
MFPRTQPVPPAAPPCPEQSHHPNPQLGGRGPALRQRALIEILAHSHDALLQVHVPGVDRVPCEAAGSDEATQSLRGASAGAGAVVDVHQGTRAQAVGRECPVRALGVAGVRGVVLPQVEALAHVCYGVDGVHSAFALFMTSASPSDVVLGLTAGCDHRRFCILLNASALVETCCRIWRCSCREYAPYLRTGNCMFLQWDLAFKGAVCGFFENVAEKRAKACAKKIWDSDAVRGYAIYMNALCRMCTRVVKCWIHSHECRRRPTMIAY